MILAASQKEPARYLLNAAAVAVINNLVLILADGASLGYVPMIAFSWFVSGSLGYALHTRFTFREKAVLSGYLRFMSGVAMGIPLAFAALYFFRSLLNLPMWSAAPAATVVMVIYNYLAARFAIRRRVF